MRSAGAKKCTLGGLGEVRVCRSSAALNQASSGNTDFVGFLMLRIEHHGRDARLLSIPIQFPKLDATGSIPVSRFKINNLRPSVFVCDSVYSVNKQVVRIPSFLKSR